MAFLGLFFPPFSEGSGSSQRTLCPFMARLGVCGERGRAGVGNNSFTIWSREKWAGCLRWMELDVWKCESINAAIYEQSFFFSPLPE